MHLTLIDLDEYAKLLGVVKNPIGVGPRKSRATFQWKAYSRRKSLN